MSRVRITLSTQIICDNVFSPENWSDWTAWTDWENAGTLHEMQLEWLKCVIWRLAHWTHLKLTETDWNRLKPTDLSRFQSHAKVLMDCCCCMKPLELGMWSLDVTIDIMLASLGHQICIKAKGSRDSEHVKKVRCNSQRRQSSMKRCKKIQQGEKLEFYQEEGT